MHDNERWPREMTRILNSAVSPVRVTSFTYKCNLDEWSDNKKAPYPVELLQVPIFSVPSFLQTHQSIHIKKRAENSGRASFGGDAHTVRKWTRHLRTNFRKCVPMKWRIEWRISKALYHHRTIQRNTEMLFSNDARFPFTILVWSFASCIVWDVLRPNPAFCVRIFSWFCVQLQSWPKCVGHFAFAIFASPPPPPPNMTLQQAFTVQHHCVGGGGKVGFAQRTVCFHVKNDRWSWHCILQECPT